MRAKGQLNERQADLLARIVSYEASVSLEDSTLALTMYALCRRGRDSPRKLRIRDTDGDLSANWFRNQHLPAHPARRRRDRPHRLGQDATAGTPSVAGSAEPVTLESRT